jgi:predicted TIM-barrel fold metal-dependent hydrolase
MSEGTHRPDTEGTDADAWAKACAEDLAAERARRRCQAGSEPGSAADELRKLAEAVVDKVAELGSPGASMAAQAMISQMKAAVGPLRERNPEVFNHLAAAGSELLAAYRAVVENQERRWTQQPSGGRPDGTGPVHIDLD